MGWSTSCHDVCTACHLSHHTTGYPNSACVWEEYHLKNIKYKADWVAIKARKEKLIAKNNAAENKKKKQHEYHEGDKILIRNEMKSKYANDPYSGPYEIVRVNRNGTLRYRKGAVTDVINIRNCTPYYE